MGLTFRGTTSESLGIKVGTYPEYEMPERNYESIHIPGRNGDIKLDQGDYENVSRKYSDVSVVDISNGYQTAVTKVLNWLNAGSGYGVLTDTYDTTHYRMAVPKNLGSIENLFNVAGRFDLEFDCKPQRYLNSGATAQTITSGNSITNPTMYDAKPVIVLTLNYSASDTGSLTIVNGTYTQSIDIALTSTESGLTSLTINSEIMDCYNGSYNKNSLVTFNSNDFPVLKQGSNLIEFNGCVTGCRITPNWWEI